MIKSMTDSLSNEHTLPIKILCIADAFPKYLIVGIFITLTENMLLLNVFVYTIVCNKCAVRMHL